MNNSYLRFLRLADTLTKSGEKSLDSLSKDILEYIFKKYKITRMGPPIYPDEIQAHYYGH